VKIGFGTESVTVTVTLQQLSVLQVQSLCCDLTNNHGKVLCIRKCERYGSCSRREF
jgi:hypothetical protein